jgi:prolipoprotein diacylglyceryltransferase
VNDAATTWWDRLPRTRVGSAAREAPAFRACGIAGFYAALIALVAGGLLGGLSLLVLGAVAMVSAASFFAWALLRRRITGRERLVLLEHVWFAELCVAAGLAAIGEPVLPYLDVMAVALCVFLAGGRVGCLLVGCCHGRPAAFGIRYGEEAAADGFPRHLVGVRLLPVPAIEAAGLLAIGASGLVAVPFAPAGTVFTWFLAAYALMRFGLEGLRGDRRPHVLGLSVNRWMCVVELTVAAALSARPLGARDAALGTFLAATLLTSLLIRRLRDPRRRLLGDDHLAELRETVRTLQARPAAEPIAETTSGGVAVAVSDEHVSFSLIGGARDLSLLCELAAAGLPDADPDSAVLNGPVLHVRPGRALAGADALYGALARRLQAPPPADDRLAYFGVRRAA